MLSLVREDDLSVLVFPLVERSVSYDGAVRTGRLLSKESFVGRKPGALLEDDLVDVPDEDRSVFSGELVRGESTERSYDLFCNLLY